MPLGIGSLTFGRDAFFYAFVAALIWYVLQDGIVPRFERLLWLVGALWYVTSVIKTVDA